MVKILFLSSVATVLLGAIQALDVNQTVSELTKGKIIPTVLNNFSPTADLRIVYKDDLWVENGVTIASSSLKNAPQVLFKASNSSEYTFLMANIDAKVPEERIQWLKTNIYAGQSEGKDVTAYKSPVQFLGGEPERLVFALFEQPSNKNINTASFNSSSSNVGDNLKQFVKDNNLKLVNAAYIYTQNQNTILKNRLQRIAGIFNEGGILDDLVGTVDNLLDNVEDILGISVDINAGKRGKKNNKNRGKNNNNKDTDIPATEDSVTEDDQDNDASGSGDDDDEDDGLLEINIGGGSNGIHIGFNK